MTPAQMTALGRTETKPAEPKAEEGTAGDLLMFAKMGAA